MTNRTAHLIASAILFLSLSVVPAAAMPMQQATTHDPYVTGTVQITPDNTPDIVWDALISAGYSGDPNDGCECLYVAVNTVQDVPGGTWTLTPDGWVGCGDFTTTGAECTGTEFLI